MVLKRAICNPEKCIKCRFLGSKMLATPIYDYYKGEKFDIRSKRFCCKHEELLLVRHDGKVIACDQCNIPEYVTKMWYNECRENRKIKNFWEFDNTNSNEN